MFAPIIQNWRMFPTYIDAHRHTHAHKPTHTHTYLHTHTHIPTHIHTHIHTRSHSHTHTTKYMHLNILSYLHTVVSVSQSHCHQNICPSHIVSYVCSHYSKLTHVSYVSPPSPAVLPSPHRIRRPPCTMQQAMVRRRWLLYWCRGGRMWMLGITWVALDWDGGW